MRVIEKLAAAGVVPVVVIENAKDVSALRKLGSIIAQPEYSTIDNGKDFPPYDDVLKSIK